MSSGGMFKLQSTARRYLICLTSMIPLAFAASLAQAADFPDHPIKLVSGSPPGGSTDAVARIMADGMGEFLHQSVIVVNQTGAGGNLATESLARAPGDGYTLMVGGNFTHGINRGQQHGRY